jgi:hypothetical protein
MPDGISISSIVRCHTLGVPAFSPDLSPRSIVASIDAMKEVVAKGALQSLSMPRFGDTLSPGDVTALQAYFIDQWWQSYDAVS